jgi:RNA polymerase sigma factor (sigma-70 family)
MNDPERNSRSVDGADLRLASAVQAKDRKATAEFVETYADTVYAYVSHRLFPNRAAAEDLVQEVFLAALQNITSYNGRAPLQAWLLGIARHKVEDHYRRALREAQFDDVELIELEVDMDMPEVIERERARDRTLRTLARLPEVDRVLLRWRYWELRSAADMAALMGRTEKSVERALARARVRFRKIWEESDV